MHDGVPLRPAASGVVLSIADVIRSLDEYLDGNVSAAEVHEWAEGYDVNEDIEFEVEALTGVVFDLTSPEINGALTVARATRIKEDLLRL
ncbi:hypothetical protein LVB87_00725 [Lysobacter sp. KIS68-7]|uniref:hypothetical protein n=1 Tax=Lysobacter sp. KIS68-7 TaxID=2904252 RepID=UPI001E46371C|nr:hypothetical protein [Lysobacter sp. KIS68-7]UHQ19727.1 hypothetical protein LVB87_00725 [Lysobacter sp. KIS68-7]